MSETQDPETLKNALEAIDEIIEKKGERNILFFFDFDGTLAPIGPDPDKVELQQNTKVQLKNLAEDFPVAIVSGRDRADIESKIGIENLYYAGSHGFDISGPNNTSHLHSEADRLVPLIEEIGALFKEKMIEYEEVWVEQKKFAVAIHYRMADEDTVKKVHEEIRASMEDKDDLIWEEGKGMVEIKPAVDWHKGKAVLWLIEHLQMDTEKSLPLYLGDDTTDEDAFRALKGKGSSILVDGNSQQTDADYLLESQRDVSDFIKKLLNHV
jgi:alpha,alpha-trehalase